MGSLDKEKVNASDKVSAIGNVCSELFHYVGLLCLGVLVVWGSIAYVFNAVSDGIITIDEILLVFIYLEIGAMIGSYFKTQNMPVKFLIYIGITALTRYLIGDISHHEEPDLSILFPCAGILLLALSALVIKYASNRKTRQSSSSTSKLPE